MKTKFAFLSFAVTLTLFFSLLAPTRVLADDGIPPTPEPTVSDPAGVTDPLPATEEPAAGSQSPEAAPESGPAAEGTAGPSSSESAPEIETVADVVEVLNDTGTVLVDEEGQALPLSTQDAAEILGSSDPYFFDGANWIGYSAGGICPPIVTTCNTNAAPFQAAINAAPAGTTLYVEAGTYAEQLIINKSLVIQGAGAGSTFIQAPAVLMPGVNGERSIVTISGAGVSVDLSGFTIEGPGPGGCGSINYGIFVRGGANADIHDNTVDGIRDDPLGGCQNGIAIGVGRAVWATSGTATLENNLITDFQKGGIVVSNSGSNAVITGNTVTGAGPTSAIAQNGIQISSGATAVITDNTVSGFEYLIPAGGYPWTSTGILLFQPGSGTTVSGNTVTDNNIGIYDYQSLNTVISNNTMSGSCSDEVGGPDCERGGWGFYSEASSSLQLKNNTLTNNVIGAEINDSAGSISYNLFSGNGTGFINDGAALLDATHNCWGSPSGPTNASNPSGSGDVVGDNVNFDPWTCPSTSSVEEKTARPTSTRSSVIIPVSGGQSVEISCEGPSMTVQLGNTQVTFSGLCGYSVVLNEFDQAALPGQLGDGDHFKTGLSITLIKDGKAIENIPGQAAVQVSFPKPQGDASILIWNGTAWEQLTASQTDGRLVADIRVSNALIVMTTAP